MFSTVPKPFLKTRGHHAYIIYWHIMESLYFCALLLFLFNYFGFSQGYFFHFIIIYSLDYITNITSYFNWFGMQCLQNAISSDGISIFNNVQLLWFNGVCICFNPIVKWLICARYVYVCQKRHHLWNYIILYLALNWMWNRRGKSKINKFL